MARTTDTPSDDDTPVRPFADFLRELAHGATHDEASEALQTLVEAVNDTGKAGSLTITISVKSINSRNAVEVTDAIKLKLPEHNREGSLFFADDHHNLRRDDPRQDSLFQTLREVPPPPGVDPTTGVVTDTKAGTDA